MSSGHPLALGGRAGSRLLELLTAAPAAAPEDHVGVQCDLLSLGSHRRYGRTGGPHIGGITHLGRPAYRYFAVASDSLGARSRASFRSTAET